MGVPLIEAMRVFLGSVFAYTIMWFVVTPVYRIYAANVGNMILNSGNAFAIETFLFVDAICNNVFCWVGILSVFTTVIWFLIVSFRREAESYIAV
ncbi:MAG: hypothetical protein QXH20_05100 [Candidatus Bathyarchaeia archaeon]